MTGSIRLNGDALDIRNGIGYMEGDRGHTFPRSYFWMQCLDVRQDASVMLAIAEIPLGPIRFTHDGGSAAGRYEPAGGGA